MLRALSGITEDGHTFTVSDQWHVTAHIGRKGAPLTAAHVVKVYLEPDFVVFETSKGHRYVTMDDEVYALVQEPSERDAKTRRAGFT